MTRKRRIYLYVVLGCLLLALGLTLLNRSMGFWARERGDLSVYMRAGGRMADNQEIYRPDDRRPFTYPPFLAVPFVPASFVPPYAHRPVWFSLNILVFFTILFLVHRNLKPWLRNPERSGSPKAWVFWGLLLLMTLRFVSSAFENLSNDLYIVLLVALCADAAARGREVLSGAMAGLGAAVKATPLLFLPMFGLQRRWAACTGLVVVLAAATLLPDVIHPRDDGGVWVLAWYRTFVKGVTPGEPVAKVGGAWAKSNILNQNLAGSIYRLSTHVEHDGDMRLDASVWRPGPRTLKVVTFAAQLLVLTVVAWGVFAGRGRTAADLAYRRYGEAGLIACGMVLLSPMSSKSHFAILILPVSFLLIECLYRRVSPVVLAHLVMILGFGALTTKGIWGRTIGNQMQAHGTVTMTALFTLSGTAIVLLRRAQGQARAEPMSAETTTTPTSP